VSPECSIYCEIGSEVRISRCAREREREEGRRGETGVLNRARISDELRRNGGLRRSIAAAWWRFLNGKKGRGERGARATYSRLRRAVGAREGAGRVELMGVSF
jgi:hypothetical protein